MSGLFIKGKWHTEFSLRSPRFRKELTPHELAVLAVEYPLTAILHAFGDLPEEVVVKVAGTREGSGYFFRKRREFSLPEAAWVAAAERDPVTALLEAAEHLPHAARLAAARKEPYLATVNPGVSSWFSSEELEALKPAAEAQRAQRAAEEAARRAADEARIAEAQAEKARKAEERKAKAAARKAAKKDGQ